MGYRLHVHKKHIIEYGDGYFNHSGNELESFLTSIEDCDLIADVYSHEWGMESKEVELRKESVKDFIEKAKEQYKDQMDKEIVNGYTISEVLDIMQEWLAVAEPDSDYIFLTWF